MEWKDIKSIIGSSAPIVGGLLGGPVGGTVGTLISTILGVEDNPEAVLNSLRTDPESYVKLKQLELNNTVKLQELKIEEARLIINDMASARQRQSDSEKATGKRDYNLYVLAWTIVIGYFSLVYTLIDGNVPEDKTGVIYLLFGTLATAFGGVIQYFFGSSAGSKEKTIQMAKMKKD